MRSGGRWAAAIALLAGVVVALGLRPGLSMRDGTVCGALGGLGFATVALVMATHGINDLYGKYIGLLALVLLIEPTQAAGIDLANLHDGSPTGAALLIYSTVVNTLVTNLPLWPVLAWGILHSRTPEIRG